MFRKVRRTDDFLGWMGLAVSYPALVMTVVGLLAAVTANDVFSSVVTGLLSVLFALVAVGYVAGLIAPYEEEFVVADAVIRWGRADRKDRQWRLPIEDIEHITIDARNDRLAAETIDGRSYILGVNVNFGRKDRRALVRFLKCEYPKVPFVVSNARY
jgi:hypothetical protein